MDIGIIGLGRLGAPLARGLSKAGISGLYGYSRSRDKAEQVAAQAPGLVLLDSAAEVLRRCEVVFIWMAPNQVSEVLDANREALSHRPILVNCSPRQNLSDYTDRWVDTYPNVNSATGQGGTLVSWGPGMAERDQETVRALLQAAGAVYELPAGQLDAYCALTSNGPAFYAHIMQTWADVVAQRHGLDVDLARAMVRQTFAGTVAAQDADHLDAAAIIHEVAHPGGSTEPGLAVLAEEFAPLAGRMLDAMGR